MSHIELSPQSQTLATNLVSESVLIKTCNVFKRRDILSGTPMTQDINDLVSQFSFIPVNKRRIGYPAMKRSPVT